MTIKSALRERRRLQTSRELQWVALSLAVRHGYDNITTEMIAAEAGISPRTFFNYYLNKGAAVIGPATSFSDQTVAWFRASSGPLLTDLLQALRQHLTDNAVDRSTVQLIDRLLGTAPELQPVFHGSLKRFADQIADLAVIRVGEGARDNAEMLATAVSHAFASTFRTWARDEAMSAENITEVAVAKLQVLHGYLAPV